MILHKKWGQILRLGNFLFKYASLNGISQKFNTDFYVPRHFMFDYFENKPKFDEEIEFDIEIFEKYHKYDLENLEKNKSNIQNKKCNFALNYFLQSPKYWEGYEEYVHHMLKFDNNLLNGIRNKYSNSLSKETIGISIRRGDFVNHLGFWQLSNEFFLYSLEKYFPNWKNCNIIFFCDDNQWVKKTFGGSNVFYSEGNFVGHDYNKNPMEQLMYGSLCDNFIISNSTFSWWLGYLSVNIKNEKGKVVHSGKNLNNHLLEGSDVKDYYHKNWIESDFYSLTKFEIKNIETRKLLL
jgi:hypothetical protein